MQTTLLGASVLALRAHAAWIDSESEVVVVTYTSVKTRGYQRSCLRRWERNWARYGPPLNRTREYRHIKKRLARRPLSELALAWLHPCALAVCTLAQGLLALTAPRRAPRCGLQVRLFLGRGLPVCATPYGRNGASFTGERGSDSGEHGAASGVGQCSR